ncbi:hypothetical protein DPMN_013034 [Dreissena polymorpha]|uniref:Uncharacterized protein n=1 Tax=Dreissena polymorpha TaxID=45954 RepID=A0A9D4S3E3_DREPO|nr:hypothetical protein DPMN_013034 [Dreissena polymorpha]
MVNSTTNTSATNAMNSRKLEEVTSFKYLGATLFKDGTSTAEVRIRQAVPSASPPRTGSTSPRSLHPSLQLRYLDALRVHSTQDTGI